MEMEGGVGQWQKHCQLEALDACDLLLQEELGTEARIRWSERRVAVLSRAS